MSWREVAIGLRGDPTQPDDRWGESASTFRAKLLRKRLITLEEGFMSTLTCEEIETLKKKARIIRRDILETYAGSGGGHFGGSLSVVEILTLLYGKVMRYDPQNSKWPERDRLILSKGHTNGALCSTLAEFGFFSTDLLKTFNQLDSPFGMHPDMHKIPGCDMSTGSLGHGSAVAAGIALAGKADRSDYFVYLILGDGECQEGTVWESASVIAHYHLNNLIAFVDRNRISQEGKTEEINNLEPFADRWRSFGWNVWEVDGHDFEQIYNAVLAARQSLECPSVIIAHTIKGKGISFMQNTHKYHFLDLSPQELETARSEFGEEVG
jgi:transketolase